MARASRATSGTGASRSSSTDAPLVVRHYCQGIGDCHLLKFRRENGSDFWMLIDCGVHSSISGGSRKIDEIAADIVETTGGRIDVLVVTHEHWDHVSGFLTAAEHFKKLKIGVVWMAWTENPADADAMALDRFRGDATRTLQLAASRLDQNTYRDKSRAAVKSGLNTLQGFTFGAAGEKVRSARDAAKALGRGGVQYMEPGQPAFELDGVPGIKVYVLGPPRDTALLKLTTKASEMYGVGLAPGWRASQALRAAPGLGVAETGLDPFMPFGAEEGVGLQSMLDRLPTGQEEAPLATTELMGRYLGSAAMKSTRSASRATLLPDPDVAWRRIDDDWLFASAELAMQFDSRTNNTSLVLAFEIAETGRVMLFAADAQIGNWLSWQAIAWDGDGKPVTGPDLLARTVYLKVGHHGSENATPDAKGLELMVHPDLSAFVPVNAADAAKVGWGKMPFRLILDRLAEKTSGRTIRADDKWLTTIKAGPQATQASGSIRGIRHKQNLWVEVDLE
jgi:hypothetical protein